MLDKNMLRTALEVVDRPDAEVLRCPPGNNCSSPSKIIYVIMTNCLTINNSACADWQFCSGSSIPSIEALAGKG